MTTPTMTCRACRWNRVPSPLWDLALCESCCWKQIEECVRNAGRIRRVFVRRRMRLVMAGCRGRGMQLWHVRRMYAMTVGWGR